MTAHRMAMASRMITSTAIEAREFSEMSGKYDVYSVPKIIINDQHAFVGGLPEANFIDAVLSSITDAGFDEGRTLGDSTQS
ncbi:MAG: thioredoxin family protein [Actinobacteria bacterium]|nr:thioredoxin family protein [Actinomycetota bacterium]